MTRQRGHMRTRRHGGFVAAVPGCRRSRGPWASRGGRSGQALVESLLVVLVLLAGFFFFYDFTYGAVTRLLLNNAAGRAARADEQDRIAEAGIRYASFEVFQEAVVQMFGNSWKRGEAFRR